MAVTAPRLDAPDREQPPQSGALATDIMLLAMSLIWGINFSVVKFGTEWLEPLVYNATRIVLAALAFVVVARWSAEERPSASDRRALVLLGMLGQGIYQILFILGLARSRAGTAALVLAAGPEFSALIGRARGSEFLSRRGWLGIALQLAGMGAVVFGASRAGPEGRDSLLGMLLILGGALAWAFVSVLVQPYTDRVGSLQLGALTTTGGAVLVAAMAIPGALGVDWGAVRLPVWGAVLYSGILALVVANIFWIRGVRRLGPTHVAMFSNLQPMIALVIAWIALGEVPTPWQLIGAGGIMTGLLISRT